MHDWGSDWTVDTLLDPLTTVSLQIRDNELRKCVGRSDPVTLTAVPCVPCEVNAVLLGEPPLRVGIDGPAWRRGHRPLDPLLLTEHSILKPVRRGSPPGPASRPAGECETGLRRWTPYLLRGIPKRALVSLSRTELYYTSPATAGNPDLRPEHSWTYELVYSWVRDRERVSLTTFARRGRDLIDSVLAPDDVTYRALNLRAVNTEGVELVAARRFVHACRCPRRSRLQARADRGLPAGSQPDRRTVRGARRGGNAPPLDHGRGGIHPRLVTAEGYGEKHHDSVRVCPPGDA